MTRRPRILITCGETSGDMHAAKLVEHLILKYPDADIVALGGDLVAGAGARVIHHMDDYNVLGFTGVLANLPRFFRLERALKRLLDDGIDLYIPVDYPGLNLRLAAHAKSRGVPVLYYISPQVWAWGAGRVDKIAKTVDYMTVILPFEEQIYKERGIDVEFVGHPFVEDHDLPPALPASSRAGIGLLPGSRQQEIRRILPTLLGAAKHIRAGNASERFRIGVSPAVPLEVYERIVDRCGVDVELADDTTDVMMNSRLLLVASGTATLQAALYGTPMVIVYRVSPLNYFIASRVVKIDSIGLVNIVLGSRVCPEFVQGEARPEAIASQALELLNDSEQRDAMVLRFDSLRESLAGSGGCRRVAEISTQLIPSS